MHIADRLGGVTASASTLISQQVRELRSQGRDIIDLGIGQPDFDTPAHIVEAAAKAGRDGQTRYPPIQGTVALREAVSEKFFGENDLSYSPDEVIVSNGAKQVIFNALMASVEPGDEVLLCAPFFDSYGSMVRVVGGVPVLLNLSEEHGFILQADALAAAITPKTRWLMLNSPGNPTGAVYSAADYQALAPVLREHPHVQIMSDEIYEHIVLDLPKAASFAAANSELKFRTLTVNGASKAYAMTGFRIGYGGGPPAMIQAMKVVQSQISSGACSLAQAAAVAALTGPQDFVQQACAAYKQRRDLMVEGIEAIPGLSLRKPGGAFYALVNVAALTRGSGAMKDDMAVAQSWLEGAGVAGVPGTVYGLSPFVRFSLAAATSKIQEGLERLKTHIEA